MYFCITKYMWECMYVGVCLFVCIYYVCGGGGISACVCMYVMRIRLS